MTIPKKFFFALATLVGTIVGVGLFGLPYLTAQTSFATILVYFVLIGAFAVIMQLVYGEIVLKTKGQHQFSGYTRIYLGHKWKILAFLVEFLAITGALTAYLIVGGDFLFQLLGPVLGGSMHLYVLTYFALGAWLVYLGIKSVAKSEFILLFVLIGAVALFFFSSLEQINFSYLKTSNLQNIILPYGAVIFSLWGVTVIPEISEMLDKQHKYLKKVIPWGVAISIAIYILFIITVVGLSGSQTSPEAIPGLIQLLPPYVIKIALILGLLTTFTSFLAMAEAAKRAFIEDWRLSPRLSWVFCCILPPILYFLGLRNFLNIIGIVGAIMLGIFGITLFAIYLKIKNNNGEQPSDYNLNLPNWLVYFFIIILVLGVLTETLYPIIA